jgi:hypothetical protein
MALLEVDSVGSEVEVPVITWVVSSHENAQYRNGRQRSCPDCSRHLYSRPVLRFTVQYSDLRSYIVSKSSLDGQVGTLLSLENECAVAETSLSRF